MSGYILVGDAYERLGEIESESVHCVVTSPPYWGLRDYGVNGQFGLEATPEVYIEKLVLIFREVRRVLRSDGTLWLNMGDAYAANGGHTRNGSTSQRVGRSNLKQQNRGTTSAAPGYKPKDLYGLPWMAAFALRSDGWFLRSDIIWHKPNAMPESVMDRPTRAHEFLFLLSKSAKYFYDNDATREPYNQATIGRYKTPMQGTDSNNGQIGGRRQPGGVHNPTNAIREPNPLGRNRRSVWSITTQPYPEAHFATFPEGLVEPCILAGCPVGGTVLDPFVGSGTTLIVAERLGRKSIGIELNEKYVELAIRRIRKSRERVKV